MRVNFLSVQTKLINYNFYKMRDSRVDKSLTTMEFTYTLPLINRSRMNITHLTLVIKCGLRLKPGPKYVFFIAYEN